MSDAEPLTPAQPEPTELPPRRRHRIRSSEPRRHALLIRFSDEEFEMVNEAALLQQLTPSGYVGQTAADMARGTIKPLPPNIGAVYRELVEARTQLRKYGVLLNQAVAKLNATGQLTPDLPAAVSQCQEAGTALTDALMRLARRR